MSTKGMHLGGVRTLADIHARCEEVGECWEWQRYINTFGVPQVGFRGMPRPARRVAWEMVNGTVPNGKVISHTCGNFRCVNPAHAHPVTPRAVLKKNHDNSNATLRAARISATKRAQMGISADVVAAIKADPNAHVTSQAQELGVSRATIYKVRKQAAANSPWAGLLMGAQA